MTSRGVALLALLALAAGCESQAATPPAAALFDPDPVHPWNRLHRALFVHQAKAPFAECLLGKTACTRAEGPAIALKESKLVESGDSASNPYPSELAFLTAEPGRLREVLASVENALGVRPTSQQSLAAVLLQNDLWVRFDALDFWLRRQQSGDRLSAEKAAAYRALQAALGKMIRRLALPRAAIAAIRPNLPEVVAAHPDLLAALDSERGWVEVGTESDAPHEIKRGTRHALIAGYTSVFRVLVRVPPSAGGADWLRRALAARPAALELLPGTRLVILQMPSAVSDAGEIVAVPIVTLVETMKTLPLGAAPATLAELPFDALEGRRALLVSASRAGGGLERLALDAPFRVGAGCAQRNERQPLRNSCLLCHDRRGAELRDLMNTQPSRIFVIDDRRQQARVAGEEKRARADFAALRRFF